MLWLAVKLESCDTLQKLLNLSFQHTCQARKSCYPYSSQEQHGQVANTPLMQKNKELETKC